MFLCVDGVKIKIKVTKTWRIRVCAGFDNRYTLDDMMRKVRRARRGSKGEEGEEGEEGDTKLTRNKRNAINIACACVQKFGASQALASRAAAAPLYQRG